MGVKIFRRSSSAKTRGDVLFKGDEIGFNREIYKKLGNRTFCKTLTVDSANTSFNRFMLDLVAYDETGIATPEIVAMDDYLGSLGLSEDYPFIDDKYETPGFTVENNKQSPIRNVISDNIIDDNVIYFDGLDTYNVVYHTGA